jgi:small subunit ribosomal protein S2
MCLGSIALRGNVALFVGTGDAVRDVIEREAIRCHMPYVNERWMPGTLTNFGSTRWLLEHASDFDTSVEIARVSAKKTRLDRRLLRTYGMIRRWAGLREMRRLPECLVIVDPVSEAGAVGEARKMNRNDWTGRGRWRSLQR